jgi:integrase
MKIKYLEERERSNGRKVWVVNPPKYVRDAVQGADYEQYESRTEAVERATLIAQAYKDHQRGLKQDIRIPQDTVDGLVAFYKSTNEYKKLKENSKALYLLMIRTACNSRIGQATINFGEMKATTVSPTHSDKLYEILCNSYSEHRAVHVCKVMRKIWYVGKRHGKVQFNPFEKMGIKGLKSRVVLWEPEQFDAYVTKADEIGLEAIGTLAMLCYHLCQRPGDMRQLKWRNYDNGVIRFVQEKTQTEVEVPCSPQLVARLDALKASRGDVQPDDYIVLCERTKRPYDRFLYVKDARRVRVAAGLPDTLQLRDFRRTGATEMAESGCTEDELRSVTGHQSRDVLSIYVRPTKKLAAAGISKRFGGGATA